MFGLLSDFRELIALLFSLGGWIILGAAVGVIGWALGKASFFPGLIASAVAGAVLVSLAVIFDWVVSNDERELRAELAVKELKLAEEIATSKALNEYLKEAREADVENTEVISDLKSKLEKIEDDPSCDIPQEVIDDLNKIR